MAARIAATEPIEFCPSYRFFVVRDTYADAAVGAGEALEAASADVAGSSGYGVYVDCAQDLLRIRAELEVWDGPPPDDSGWEQTGVLPLECATGEVQLGNDDGSAVIVLNSPPGPGTYAVRVLYAGRERAVETLRQLDMSEYDRHSGIERYRVQAWWVGGYEDEDDDD